ncbi:nose resistant to fluoxetine protein 6-like, partial [Stegodyphus dumicola]|uniref:nose resistant to fluoxetine protein 6-like n=1 Tax=Stegodyphus dumicola TaxID=202533 RepID=UPI0015B295C3
MVLEEQCSETTETIENNNRSDAKRDILPGISEALEYVYAFQGILLVIIIDAWGKPGDGLFEGNFGYVGDYDECVNLVIPELKDQEGNPQKGLYCLVHFTPVLPPKPQLYTLFHKIPELANITSQNTSFAETAKNAHWFYLLGLRIGVCMPNSCTADDVYSILEQ